METKRKNGGLAAAALLAAGAVLVAVALVAVGYAGTNSGNLDPAKQDVLERLQATRAAQIQFAQDHPEEIPTRNPTTMPTIRPTSWSVGILVSGQAPMPGSQYVGVNSWSWDLDGNHVIVYAGSEGLEGRNPGRGVIAVLGETMSLQPLSQLGGWYRAPPGVGALRIVSFQGTLLTLQASTGQTFYFDAETRAFTDANGSPVPTDTPTPTPPPPQTPEFTLPPIDFGTDTPAPTAAPTAQPTLAATAAVGG
jgi:hypothetical protein